MLLKSDPGAPAVASPVQSHRSLRRPLAVLDINPGELLSQLAAWGRSYSADKPWLRQFLRLLWRKARLYQWAGTRGGLYAERRVLDAATSLRDQAEKWAWAADQCVPLGVRELAAALSGGSAARGIVLSISHDDYAVSVGGTQNVIGDEQRAFAEAGWRYLHVSPGAPLPVLGRRTDAGAYKLRLRLGGRSLGTTTFADLVECLATTRHQGTRVETVIHHLKGHVPELLATLPAVTGARPIVWVHDFFTLCPNFNLMRNDVRFCGAPAEHAPACTICVFAKDRQEHLPRINDFFLATRPTILAPSQAALALWQRHGSYRPADAAVIPLARLEMSRLCRTAGDATRRPLRVAHLGAPAIHKGWHVFQALAGRHAGDSRYKFYHFGNDPVRSLKYQSEQVRVSMERRDAMIQAVLKRRIDVVICWSLWPETFCFTVHEALAAGTFILARQAAGNIWAAVQANAPNQGRAVDTQNALFELFKTGEIRTIVAASRRFQGDLLPGGDTADFLLAPQPACPIQTDLEVANQ
jgi:hypothetical protein